MPALRLRFLTALALTALVVVVFCAQQLGAEFRSIESVYPADADAPPVVLAR